MFKKLANKNSNYAWIFFLLKVSRALAFSWSNVTYVLFLLDKGMDLATTNLINIGFMSTVLVIDPFTGRLADKIGQRVIFVAGLFVASLGMFAYAVSGGLWQFILSEFIVGIGYSLMSEAPESWLRNRVGKQESHRIQSSVGAYMRLLTTIPALGGSILGTHFGYAYPWFVGGLLGVIFTVFLIMNVFDEEKIGDANFEERESIWESFSSSFRHKHIRFVFLVVIVTRACYQPFNMFWSQILEEMTGNASWLGYFWVTIAIAMALGSRAAKDIKVFSKLKLVVVMIMIGLSIAIPTISGDIVWIVIGFVIHEVFRELLDRVVWTYANDFISDYNRSTMNSIRSSVSTGANIMGLAISGVLVRYYSALEVWIISGVLLVVFALVLVIDCRKN